MINDLIGLFTEPIGEAFVELLNSLGIGAIWREKASWQGCPIRCQGWNRVPALNASRLHS
jgi:hypothetical protein